MRSCRMRLDLEDGVGPKRACMAGWRDVVDFGGGREPEEDVERALVVMTMPLWLLL
jgi:hypothetical protein